MATQSLKELVQRLFADNEFLQSFLRAPEQTLAGQSISSEERRALLRLHTRLATAGGSEVPFVGPQGEWP